MTKLDNHIDFVKQQIVAQDTMAEKFKDQKFRADRHKASAYQFSELLKFLQNIETAYVPSNENGETKSNIARRMLLSLEEIEDLPPELIAELNISETDKQELVIEDIVKKAGGVLSLDKIMVELYRRTNEIAKRNTLTSRLYRMVQKKMIFNVPGRKGLYSSLEMSEDDVRRLFGDLETEPANV